ncbi:hypothetical protein E4T39_06407 [Aureobasidium subglaciale]|nr:hypothetical protein E4T39_06407 [Aureobasidium subglaciale]
MREGNQPSASTAGMVVQHKVSGPVQPGPTEEQRQAHELETNGYCIVGDFQLCCNAGAAAQARRGKPAKQHKQETVNTNLTRENKQLMGELRLKDCVIHQKSLEIQEQCARILDLQQGQIEMRRDYRADMSERDHIEATYLADLRELGLVHDEEIEVLRSTIDRQALPPAYSDINISNTTTITDLGPTSAQEIITSASTFLRKALAEAPPQICPHSLLAIAKALHESLRCIKNSQDLSLWPRSSSTSLALHAVHEMVDRVISWLILSSSSESRAFGQCKPIRFPLVHLRAAFSAADALVHDLCSLHFCSGGRRTGLSAAQIPFLCDDANGEVDKRDDFLELQWWKTKFEGTRVEGRVWREDVGVVVSEDTGAWLEATILSLV